jgi:hypothetical protein
VEILTASLPATCDLLLLVLAMESDEPFHSGDVSDEPTTDRVPDIQDWELDTDEINSIGSDELYERRPNRWRGPAGTWRSMTEGDRQVHTSLEDLKKQDLAVHLYNAFALKTRKTKLRPPPQDVSYASKVLRDTLLTNV